MKYKESEDQPGRGAYLFFADNTSAITSKMFNARFNEAVILHGRVGVPDVWAVNSPNVSGRLDGGEGTELLRQGLVFLLRRDSAPSFDQMLTDLLKKGAHMVSEDQRDYARRLDGVAGGSIVSWNAQEVRQAYIDASDVLLTEEVLQALGITPEGSALIVGTYDSAKRAYHACADSDPAKQRLDPFNNTWVFDRVSENGSKRLEGLSLEDGNRVWSAARTMYLFNIPSLKELAVAAEDGFDGTAALAVLRRHMRGSADLMITPADLSTEGAFRATLGTAPIAWLFSADVISSLTAEELTAATCVEYAHEYHRARNAFLANPNEANWLLLVGAMKTYLGNGADEIIRLRRRAGIFRDPADVNVHLIGGAASLRMESGADGVEMTGLLSTSPLTSVQVVARHIAMPVLKRGDDGRSNTGEAGIVTGSALVTKGGSGSGARIYSFPTRPAHPDHFRRAA